MLLVIQSVHNVMELQHIVYRVKIRFIIINTHAIQFALINFMPKLAVEYVLLALIYATIALIKLIV